MTLRERTRAVLDQAAEVYRDTPHAPRLAALATRLDGPLRVAVAGRVKAGKSTLLNALVADRLAPTDAGECTRIVTWYEDGHTYRVTAHPVTGEPRQVPFARTDGALTVDLGDLPAEQVATLTVTWPSQALRTATFIDTPGIGSLSADRATRTWDALAPEEDDESPADAVVYLLRHVHRDDLEFLRAVHDPELSQPNPVNAVGVLSRADEIGGGRLDAMAGARRTASRMAADPALRRVVQTVVPVAGLLAETAATLTEAETAGLRTLSGLPPRKAEQLLLSADRFRHAESALALDAAQREALLSRFGLYGLRLAVSLLRHRVAHTASDLATALTERSGVGRLRETLDTLFFARRDVLQSRSTLLALAALTRHDPRPGSDTVAAAVEEIQAAAHPFRELRVLAALRAGWLTGKPDVLAELDRLVGGDGDAAHLRLGLAADSGPDEITRAARDALARWQRRVEHPLTARDLAVAGRVAVRSCEGILADPGISG